jgi:hypothetical protein
MREEKFSDKLRESRTYIKNSLTTSINFEGNAPSLLIDELQFLLNPGCVIIESPAESFANILPDEREVLLDCTKDFPWEQDGGKTGDIQVSHQNFQPIEKLYKGKEPLRSALQEVTVAHKLAIQLDQNQWKLTIYHNPSSVLEPFWKVPEFFEFIAEVIKLISNVSRESQVPPHYELKRLSSPFPLSQYLESIFWALCERIAAHLSKISGIFKDFAQDPFFIQFFLVVDNDTPENKKRWLRFFPLQAQRDRLDNRDTVKKIQEKLEAKHLPIPPNIHQFITDYRWDSNRAFVGYSHDCGASLYLKDWLNEPRAKGVHLSEDEKEEREIATTIMQLLRGETPHLFIFPLFANKETIGAVVINCPEDIEPSYQINLARFSRELGFLVALALDTDDLVNHLQEAKQKAAQMQSYRNATESILHDEGSYCMTLDSFLKVLKETGSIEEHPNLEPYFDQISYIIRDKINFIEEFASRVPDRNPIRDVPIGFLYPTLRGISPEEADIPLNYIEEMLELSRSIFCRDGNLKINFIPGPYLRTQGKIVNFEYYVLARIFTNLLRNSSRVATQRTIEHPIFRLTMDIVSNNGRDYLQIIGEDNCGGFKDEILQITKGDITFDSWSIYLNLKQEETPRGLGFLNLARYAKASEGHCRIDNVSKPERGAKVEILLGLRSGLNSQGIAS